MVTRFVRDGSAQWKFELAEKPLVFAPPFVNADVEIEENARAERGFELLPRIGADALDHVAALADHDRLLRVALDEDRRVNLDEILLFVFFPAVDVDGGR